MARIFGWVGVIFGILRLLEYFFFGDLHSGYALGWAIHAFVSGILLLWLSEEKRQSD